MKSSKTKVSSALKDELKNVKVADSSISDIIHSIKLKVKLIGEETQKIRASNSELSNQLVISTSQQNKLNDKFNETNRKRESVCADVASMQLTFQNEQSQYKNSMQTAAQLNEQYCLMVKEYEQQLAQHLNFEQANQVERANQSTKNKDKIKMEEIRNADLKNAHARLLVKRKDLQKMVEDSAQIDSIRKKQIADEETIISSIYQKYNELVKA